MRKTPLGRLLALLLALVLVAAACSQRDDDEGTDTTGGGTDTTEEDGGDGGPGAGSIDTADCLSDPTAEVEGDVIKLVSSFPQSGLTAAFAQIRNGWTSYFQYLNEELGGVTIADRTFTIETEDKDDEYNAQQTAQNIEEMLGTDGENAFAVFSTVGTSNNISIRDSLNELCVPNMFAATGSPAWGNPAYPWTIGSTLPAYSLEGKVFADYLLENKPDAKVAMLVQADDFGAAYEEGFRNAIEGTDIEVVAVETYQAGANEAAAQVTSLASSGADAFFNGATLLACPNALENAKLNNWTPITWISTTCTSKTLMGIADTTSSNDGVLSMTNIKDPLNPVFAEDEDMALYREKVEQYGPDGTDADNAIVAYGWTQAAMLVAAMEAAEAPSRLAVMESVRNMSQVTGGLLLPEVSVTTASPDDAFMGETVNLVQYSLADKHFNLVGELIDFEGMTAELTPEDLINA